MIRKNYHPEADVLHTVFGREGMRSDTSEDAAPGVHVDFDPSGNPIGVEITNVSKRTAQRPKAA